MPNYKSREGVDLTAQDLAQLVEPYSAKFAWYLSHERPYVPHYWQTLFHTMRNGDKLCRFRHLVAGRRGGKTLSAAWELLFYLLFPEWFHLHAHAKDDDRPLFAWVLTRDYPAGLPALQTFRSVLQQAGLENGKDYKEHRGNRWFEFNNGSFLAFKTADEPDSLRGAGLDMLWMDEAAFVPDERAWETVSPGLSDKLGLLITTTTPSGKNWFYKEFWSEEAMRDPAEGRVEYWSIDNPYFAREEWERQKARMHPLIFKREFCAAFDAMSGKELHGDWLHYYEWDDLPRKDGRLDLNFYMGVDPAISLSDRADRFSIAIVGVNKDGSQAYLVDQYADRIPFPEQLIKIAEYAQLYHPQQIGIESTAYQAALSQQALRLPGLLPIAAIFTRGKKSERILSMAPLFRTARIMLRKDHRDFINEWLDYDSTLKNPEDDCLDAVEIAIRSAGALLPVEPDPSPFEEFFPVEDRPAGSLDELAWSSWQSKKPVSDTHLGPDW